MTIVLQCKEDIFNDISTTIDKEMKVVEAEGGDIDCFENGWIFIKFTQPTDNLVKEIMQQYPDSEYVIGIKELNMIISNKVNESQRYIHVRRKLYTSEYTLEMMWCAKSYLEVQ